MANGRGHSGHAWREVRRIVASRGHPCYFCGGPIDSRVKYPHPYSFSVHCIIPVSRGGAPELHNATASHLRCNQQQGNKMPWEGTRVPTWIIEEVP